MKQWNEGWKDSIMTDVWSGASSFQPIHATKKSNGVKSADEYVCNCPECDRLWEYAIKRVRREIRYVPKCNSIRYGKKDEICPSCK